MNCVNCQQPKENHDYDKMCKEVAEDTKASYREGVIDINDLSECFYTPEFPKYLNVYRVDQCYGGAEEGGWWYDAGTPLESIRVDDADEGKNIRHHLEVRYELTCDGDYAPFDKANPDRLRQRGRTSAAGGYDVVICEEYEFAEPFPQERPRYE